MIFTQGSRRRNKERGMRMKSHGDIHILSLKTKNEEIKLTNKINKQKVTFNARGTKFQITKDFLFILLIHIRKFIELNSESGSRWVLGFGFGFWVLGLGFGLGPEPEPRPKFFLGLMSGIRHVLNN